MTVLGIFRVALLRHEVRQVFAQGLLAPEFMQLEFGFRDELLSHPDQRNEVLAFLSP